MAKVGTPRKSVIELKFKKGGKMYHLTTPEIQLPFTSEGQDVAKIIKDTMATVGATMKNTTQRVHRVDGWDFWVPFTA